MNTEENSRLAIQYLEHVFIYIHVLHLEEHALQEELLM